MEKQNKTMPTYLQECLTASQQTASIFQNAKLSIKFENTSVAYKASNFRELLPCSIGSILQKYGRIVFWTFSTIFSRNRQPCQSKNTKQPSDHFRYQGTETSKNKEEDKWRENQKNPNTENSYKKWRKTHRDLQRPPWIKIII